MLLSSIYLAFAGLIISAAPVGATASSEVPLPKPSGAYQVGRSATELVDHSRTQPFAPDVEPRRLMITVFYPVSSQQPLDTAAYMPQLTARFEDRSLSTYFGLAAPNGTFEKVAIRLASSKSSRKSVHESAYPVVLFMPAEGTTRLFYSLIAQTVSSNGFTVVTIDTPYDVDIVEYPDGSVTLLNQTVVNNSNATELLLDAALAVQTRAQDASFVLDSLSNTNLSHKLVPDLPLSGLNTTHVAMFGHSLGGAAAAATMLSDDRVIGGLNMDGALYGPVVQKGLDRPFMIMAHANHTRANSDPLDSWAKVWPNLRGWKRDILVAKTLHYDFSDYPIVFETLGITPGNKVAEQILLGSLEGARALKIVTSYVTAFLNYAVHGKGSPLLKGPVKQFPEVTFED